MPRRPVTLVLLLVVAATGIPSALAAQAPDPPTLSALAEGTRIRANGPAVRDQIGLSFSDILERGLMGVLMRPPAEGVVVDATPGSFRFAASDRSRLVDVPWSGVDYVDVFEGRSVGLGVIQGAGLGAFSGLVMWGLIEFIFLAADNPVVEDPEYLIGIGAGAGALVGAGTLGNRWNRVYPPES